MTEGSQDQREREEYAAAEDDDPPSPRVAQDEQERFDQIGDQPGHGQQNADLQISQTEVRANHRPGCLLQPEDQLVQELDQQKNHEPNLTMTVHRFGDCHPD